MLTKQLHIDGETYTIYRGSELLPSAEVNIQRGSFDNERRPDLYCNTQYGVITDTAQQHIEHTALGQALITASREYQAMRHAAEQAAEQAREAAETAAAEAQEARVYGADRVWVVGQLHGWYEVTRERTPRPTGRRVLPVGPITAYDPEYVGLLDDAFGVYAIRKP